MQLVVLLLLVAGLAFLVLGLITGSTPLVLASIAASLLAVGAIVRHRRRQEDTAVGTAQQPGAARVGARVPELASLTGTPAQDAGSPAGASPVVVPPPAHAAKPAHAAAAAEPAHAAAELVPNEPSAAEPADPEPAEADTDPPLRSRGDEPVWVIDGRPRYHLSGCAFLIGREPEPVPLRQAVEDGFTPCALCDPDSGLVAR